MSIRPITDIPLPDYSLTHIRCKCGKRFFGLGGLGKPYPSRRWRKYSAHWIRCHA